jgi:hypothetical protein
VIKAFDKGPHAGKFSVKYKNDPNWWTHSLLREGYAKGKRVASVPGDRGKLRQSLQSNAARIHACTCADVSVFSYRTGSV